MPWWLGVLGATALITVNNLLLRTIGFRPYVILLLAPLVIGANLSYGYAFGNAPKFLHVWFLGAASMAILGLGASYMMDRGLALWDFVGVLCIALGISLLVR